MGFCTTMYDLVTSVGLIISYVGVRKSYVGVSKSYVGVITSYVDVIKGSISLKNRHFIIQERFTKLLYGIKNVVS